MTLEISYKLIMHIAIFMLLVPVTAIEMVTTIKSAFADIFCLGPLACSAIGGAGGRGGDTGDAIGGDIGPGGSCFVNYHSSVGDECGGSTGSSEPRSGSGDHSMNGERGGDAILNLGN
jgi:hypothetical protein